MFGTCDKKHFIICKQKEIFTYNREKMHSVLSVIQTLNQTKYFLFRIEIYFPTFSKFRSFCVLGLLILSSFPIKPRYIGFAGFVIKFEAHMGM